VIRAVKGEASDGSAAAPLAPASSGPVAPVLWAPQRSFADFTGRWRRYGRRHWAVAEAGAAYLVERLAG